MNLVTVMTAGLWLGTLTQLNHVNADALLSSPNSNGVNKEDQNLMMKQNWAEMQIAMTVDYAIESWFWTVFAGALNHQVAHHLFPGMLQTYYPQITPIVKKTCTEFGLHYHTLPSIWDALRCHLGYLKVMGATPKPQTKG